MYGDINSCLELIKVKKEFIGLWIFKWVLWNEIWGLKGNAEEKNLIKAENFKIHQFINIYGLTNGCTLATG